MALVAALTAAVHAPGPAAASSTALIVTAAGGGSDGVGDGGAATSAQLGSVPGVAVDRAGNLYISDTGRVRKVDPAGTITTVAGNGTPGSSGDGGPAPAAQVVAGRLAVDGAGNLYIAGDHRVRRVDPAGTITTVAGNGTVGRSGDGGPAIAAQVGPSGLAVDRSGNLYIAENGSVRRVDGSGTIDTVVGAGVGFGGDGGPARDARLYTNDVAFDGAGNLYIADGGNKRVRKVVPGTDGTVDGADIITTLAGTGAASSTGDGGRASEATLYEPDGVAADASGHVYIAEWHGLRVRTVDPSGIISTLAGTGARGYRGDGGPATEALFDEPHAVAAAPDGGVYIADTRNGRVRRVGPDLLGLAMADSPDPVATGADVTYTLTVRNYSSAPVAGVRVLDTLPAGAAFRSATPSQGSCAEGGGTVTCDLGEVAGGAAATVAVTVAAPATPATLENRATATASATDPYPQDNLATSRTTVAVPARLSLAMDDAPDPVGASQPLTYTLTVANAGPAAATNVSVLNPLPPERTILQMAASQGGCEEDVIRQQVDVRAGVRCSLGTIAPGATATAWIQVAAPAESTVLANRATVSATEPDDEAADNAAEVETVVATTARPAGVGVANEDSPDPAHAGDPLRYTLTVANALPLGAAATGVTLTDTLSRDVSFRSATATQGACAPPPNANTTNVQGGTVTCALGALGPGATAVVTIEVIPTAPGDVPNVASVSAVEAPDPSSAVAVTRVSAAGCGRLVEASFTLAGDLGPCGGDGLVVGADNVTVDLGGHRLFGFPGPGDGTQAGIRVAKRTGVTVTNGTVSDFDAGVVLRGGGGHTVTGIAAVANLGPDTSLAPELGDGIVMMRSAGNRIVGNTLVGNGQYDGIGVIGRQSDDNLIEGNTVAGTVSPAEFVNPNHNMQGILVSARLDESDIGQTISNTTIRNNVVRLNAGAGISNVNSVDGVIAGNLVEGNGRRPNNRGRGNGIGVAVGPELQDPGTRMRIEGNTVRQNGGTGIVIRARAGEVHVVGNVAEDDGADENASCGSNSWVANTWGSGYSPQCVGVTPPQTSIAAGPAATTEDPTPTFGFASDQEGSTFLCRLDGASLSVCPSPYTTIELAPGPHTMEVRARGPVGNSDPTPVVRSFTVKAPNHPPVARDDAYSTEAGRALSVAAPGVLGNDTDADGDALAAALTAGPADGTVALAGDGSFTYTPEAGFAGTDSFTYAATDPHGASATATVTISVVAPSADVSVAVVDSPDPVKPAGTVTYVVTVANAGPSPAAGAKLSAGLSGATLGSVATSQGTCSVSGTKVKTVTCVLGSVAAGASATVRITATAPNKAGTMSLAATASSTTADPDLANNARTQSTTIAR